MKNGGSAIPAIHPTGFAKAMIIVALACSFFGNQVIESFDGMLRTKAWPAPPKTYATIRTQKPVPLAVPAKFLNQVPSKSKVEARNPAILMPFLSIVQFVKGFRGSNTVV